MDAPHNHPNLKVKSLHQPHAAHITIAVLLNCEREPQYFPDMDVAKSASEASTWHGKKVRVVDGDRIFNANLGLSKAVKKVLPRGFGGVSPAVEALFKGWMAFCKSQAM